MTDYLVRVRLNRTQFQRLVEEANYNGRSLEQVAASLIGDDLDRRARARERERRATIDRLARQVGRKPPIDPKLRQQYELDALRQLAGISSYK
jgi:hypothetical protein